MNQTNQQPWQLASASENMIWKSNQHICDIASSTLSYSFVTKRNLCYQQIQQAMILLLTEHLPTLNLRFVETNGVLYKQLFPVSQSPVELNDSEQVYQKPNLIRPLQTQYRIFWKPRKQGGELILHLSHLVIDGSSYNSIVNALNAAFNMKKTKFVNSMVPIKITTDNESYWSKALSGRSLSQDLPFLNYGSQSSYLCRQLEINKTLFTTLSTFTKQHKVSIFQTLTTGLAILLYSYLRYFTEPETLCISYFTNLKHDDSTVGCHINLLPLFIDCSSHQSALELLNKIKLIRSSHRPHQHVPTELLTQFATSKLNQQQPLFNIVINESVGLLPKKFPAKFTAVRSLDNRSAARPLTLIYHVSKNSITIRFESNIDIMHQAIFNCFVDNFKPILERLLTSPKTNLSQFDVSLSDMPISTGRQFPLTDNTLLNNIQAMTLHEPNKIAITDSSKQITYQNLAQQINAVQTSLNELDKNELSTGVGLFLSRGNQLPTALVAAIGLGITIIPIVTEQPRDKIKSIIDITQLSVVLTDNQTDSLFEDIMPGLKRINLNHLSSNDSDAEILINTERLVTDIAYTIFTSGSTGTPKGVQVSYENLENFLCSMTNHPGMITTDSLLAITPICFDIAMNELLLPLYTGASMVIANSSQRKNGNELANLINRYQISILQSTPATIMLLKNVKFIPAQPLRIWVGGEALPCDVVDYVKQLGCQLYNMYGPTEATIWASSSQISDRGNIVLGKAVDNSKLYVVDDHNRCVPFGIPGELIIEGKAVTAGYLNADMKKFDFKQQPRFATGDKVVALDYDQIRYIERLDEQVKLRGYRIELSEITNTISKLIPQAHCVTVLRQQSNPTLCVFYTMESADLINHDVILSQLNQQLADYKIPQSLIRLNSMPVNQNGKIDKKALSLLPLSKLDQFDSQASTAAYSTTNEQTDLTRQLIQLIKNHFTLSIDKTERTLIDYGFNSISFNQLATILNDEFDVDIKPHQFYQYCNIDKITQYLLTKTTHKSDYTAIIDEPKSITTYDEQIAIIGFDALMPGSKNADEFWQSLVAGDDLICNPNRKSLNVTDRFAALTAVDEFDHAFFKLSPLEVMQMDPRQRLLLQCAYKTLEHAGWPKHRLAKQTVGCFIAGTGLDYLLAQIKQDISPRSHGLTGNLFSMLANRLSYYFDWHGPSVTIDTACSGSLSALARAVDTLRLKKADCCFVAAANLIVDNYLSDSLRFSGVLSDNYRCASFAENADGYVRGEGVIGFLLKPLSKALVDGDHIHAVIESVAENHGGQSASATAPNQNAQTTMLLNAYSPQQRQRLAYIETHGTGTHLGDPIEIDALLEFEKHALTNNKHQTIYLGAVKSSIGHLESAAGFASILKVIFSMKNHYLPANLHAATINKAIHLEQSKFELVNQPVKLKFTNDCIAGVSSFGFGGSNVHVVLSHYQTNKLATTNPQSSTVPILLSAANQSALLTRVNSLIADLNQLSSHTTLYDIGYTLAVGRELLPVRLVLLATNKADLQAQLIQIETSQILSVSNIQNIDFIDDFIEHPATIVPLTSYTFQRNHYWFTDLVTSPSHNQNLLAQLSYHQTQASTIEVKLPTKHRFFSDHHVFDQPVLPGVAQIELLIEAFSRRFNYHDSLVIENVFWVRPVIAANANETLLTIQIKQLGDSQFTFDISGANKGLYSRGSLRLNKPTGSVTNRNLLSPTLITNQLNRCNIYQAFIDTGLHYGNYFQGIDDVLIAENTAQANITVKPDGSLVALLDSAFQSGMAISLSTLAEGLMPFSLGQLKLHSIKQLRNITNAKVYTTKLSPYRTNLSIYDNQDNVLLELTDLGVKSSQILKYELPQVHTMAV